MNYLILIALTLFGASCSKQDPTENEELKALDYRVRISEQTESQEIFAIDLQQYYTISQISILEQTKKELVEQIEAGNKNLLPELESITKKLLWHYNSLENTLDTTCLLLKLRYEVLSSKISEGNQDALDELLRIKQDLENCGINVDVYLFDIFKGSPIMYAASWGSKCSPGKEWKCKNSMREGRLLINIEERLAQDTEVQFKSPDGKVISTGKLLGNHSDLKGMVQIEIELSQVSEGTLEMSSEAGKIPIPIEIL